MEDEPLERTQIYLTRTERSILERVHGETGTSQSELVRRAVDRAYLGREYLTREQRLARLDASAGAWEGRTETGADYVEGRRAGRLGRLRNAE
jgi:hypothetical protein